MPVEKSIAVRIKDGLHARPAALFIKMAKSYASSLALTSQTGELTAKSTAKLMLMSIKEGETIALRLDGPDETEALSHLEAFLLDPNAGLDALDKTETAIPTNNKGLNGLGASQGIAIGAPFACFAEPLLPSATRLLDDERLQAIASFRATHTKTVARLREEGRGDAISEALASVADDDDFRDTITSLIKDGSPPDNAVLTAGQALASRFEALDDPYQRARAEDIRAISRALVLALRGQSDPDLTQIASGQIIIADELSPLLLARAPFERIGGLVCTKGSTTSHVAIMARSHGIPAILGYSGSREALKQARIIALDGSSGEVVLDPDQDVTSRFADKLAAQKAEQASLAAYATTAPKTRAGQAIEVAANLGSLHEIAAARTVGAMGVGLLRTEMLFMDHRQPPGEDEQVRLYREFAAAFAPHPVIIRALDIGADKSVPGVMLAREDNPFLGCRGVRLLLQRPELLRPQMKAVLRASVTGNIKLMIPMITKLEEMRGVHAILDECRAELTRDGIPHGRPEIGAMIETPAAALIADDLASICDFFSIGTNDLTQYVTAADRMNPQVAGLCQTHHPAVLRLIEMTCASARKAGIWVGICGEAASDPQLIPFFVKNGVRELSVSPSLVLQTKKTVTEI